MIRKCCLVLYLVVASAFLISSADAQTTGGTYHLSVSVNIQETDFPSVAPGQEGPTGGWEEPVSMVLVWYRQDKDGTPYVIEYTYTAFYPGASNFPGYLQFTTDYEHAFSWDDKWYVRILDPYSFRGIDQYVYQDADRWNQYRVRHSPTGSILQQCHPSVSNIHSVSMQGWHVKLR